MFIHVRTAVAVITPCILEDENKDFVIFFVDKYTHYCATYLIAHKSDVFVVFRNYVAKSETHLNLRMVNLYCNMVMNIYRMR